MDGLPAKVTQSRGHAVDLVELLSTLSEAACGHHNSKSALVFAS